ncbi:MAG: pyruvate carboxylase subunit B [Elusimicrobiota bacterium]
MKKLPIAITDTTLRDAQQSMWSPHISANEIKLLIRDIDQIGFHSLDVWGGGTFESSLRNWGEDPWERLSLISQNIKHTPLQMVIRGKSIVGYHHYPIDLLEEFIKTSINNGISIVRIFDPLNDINNLKDAFRIIKENKAHAQGTICYSISPSHSLKKFINFGKELKAEGADSIAIKDAAGILTPENAIALIKGLKEEVGLPLQLHSHLTSGLINVTYFEAVKNDINIIDCTLSPLSLPAAQPSVETIVTLFENTPYKPNINLDKLYSASDKLHAICRIKEIGKQIVPLNDHAIFEHQLPRGAYSFLYNQLLERNATDKLEEVLKEVPKVRKELGNPPLYIPITLFIVAQSVYNILMKERYAIIPKEIKDFVNGAYGRVPGAINQKIIDKINESSSSVDSQITASPSFSLSAAKKMLDPKYVKKETDYITFALFPELAQEFFFERENPTPKNQLESKQTQDITAEEEILMLNKMMLDKNVTEFELDEQDHYIYIRKSSDQAEISRHIPTHTTQVIDHSPITAQSISSASDKADTEEQGEFISSPIVGVFYSKPSPSSPAYVNINDKISKGQTVCIIEAMKVMNEIKAPYNCQIIRTAVTDKDSVKPNDPLFYIKKI